MASLDEFEREQAILLDLEARGRVEVNELSARFGVSTVTIRKDLDTLERRSMLRRVRGGAVATGNADEGSFEMRLRHSQAAKQAIARAVAPLVRSGDVIALDSSTTAYYLGRELLDRQRLVVITNGLKVATLFLEQSEATVLMPGGVLRRPAASMVGPIGDVLAGRGRIDKGFFGVMGISTTFGLMDIVVEEAQAKQLLAKACEQVYGIFDSSKVGRLGLHSFAPVQAVTAMYTDAGVDAAVVAEWDALGVPIHAVPVAGAPGTPGADGRAAAVPARGARTRPDGRGRAVAR